MRVFEHPRGQVLTLEPGERFVLGDEVGKIQVSTVTVFARGDEQGSYWTAYGPELGVDGRFRELDLRLRDAGLLPPHVREATQGLREFDFPVRVPFSSLPVVHEAQRGVRPIVDVRAIRLTEKLPGERGYRRYRGV